MIITVTLNPAIDKTVTISNFTAGEVNRIETLRTDVGGKGINVSKCLKELGCESMAAAFWGGDAGRSGEAQLRESGADQLSQRIGGADIQSLPVFIQETTRTNMKIIDEVQGQNTDINEPGPQIKPEELELLIQKLDENLKESDILVLAGSIPKGISPNIYKELTARYKEKGVKVFLDADGESFAEGIKAVPYLIKPNIDELSRLAGEKLTDIRGILKAVKPLLQSGIEKIVVSMGAQGAVFIQRGRIFIASSIDVPVLSTVGAGDSMVAALAYGEEKGLDEKKTYKLSMAMGAASVMCSGTQAPKAVTVESLYHMVNIIEL